jgi:drug/metabolite transporter (DMT)-like permease
MLWIFLSLLSGFFDATIYAYMKRLKHLDEIVLLWVQYLFSVPFLIPLLFFFMPDAIDSRVYAIGIVNAILLMLATWALARAFQSTNLSMAIPLVSLTPLFLLITSAIMVKEFPTPLGYVGIVLTVMGTYVLNLKESKNGILGPFIAMFTNPGPRYALLGAFLMSIMANLFKIGISYSNPLFYTLFIHTTISLVLLLVFIRKLKSTFLGIKGSAGHCIIMGFSNAAMSLTAGIALLTAIVPYMISLKRSSVLFGMFYSHHWFKEQNGRDVYMGALIMVIGAILIIMS